MAPPDGTNGNNLGAIPPYVLENANADDESHTGRYRNIIFDIGGVLLQLMLDRNYDTTVPPMQFKRMLRSNIWFEYQKGKMSPEEVFHQLSVKFGFPAEDIRSFARKARESLVPIRPLIDLLAQLSKQSKLRLICMTNCPADDFAYLTKQFPQIFGMFERIFTSSGTGIRKPSRNFFRHVLQESGIRASETLFVDDDLANITAAESLDFTVVQVSPEAAPEAVRQLMFHLRTLEERLQAAHEYLQRSRGVNKALSLTSEGLRVPVYFDHLLIAEVLNDERFLPYTAPSASGTMNFFPNEERGAARDSSTNASGHKDFPDDLDSTSVSLSLLYKFSKVDLQTIHAVLNKMEKCVDDEGIIQTYFDPLRPRVDPVVGTNVVYLFHLGGRTGPAQPTVEFLFKVLANRAYIRGTIYYRIPEAFLYQLARLVVAFKNHFSEMGFLDLLKRRLSERVGLESDALTLAMRIVACVNCGIPTSRLKRDVASLERLQNVDGSWDVCPYYSYNDPKSWFGNELLTTAFAVGALQSVQANTKAVN